MARKRNVQWFWLLLIAAALVVQFLEQRPEGKSPPPATPRPTASPGASSTPAKGTKKAAPSPPTKGYEVLTGCSLADDRNNDGDSFKIRHAGGEHEFRLYFVDAPEKRLHQYNGERLDDQGRYFGGLKREQTLAIGKAAQAFTLDLMRRQAFRVETRWQPVFDSGRYFAFVFFEKDGEELSEKLTRAGLVRIHTEGADLPDGRRRRDFERHLKTLEAGARQAGLGGWKR